MPNWTTDDLAAYERGLKQPPGDAAEPKPAPKPSRGEIKEAQVERQIIALLEFHGWLVLHTNKFCGAKVASQGAIQPGMPDLQARRPAEWRDGPIKRAANGAYLWEIIWVECKRPGGKVSTVQATWHQLAQKRGETVIVAESIDTVAAAIGVVL